MTRADKFRFQKVWRNWKTIAQTKPPLANRLVRRRCSDAKVFQKVYRLEDEGLYPWKYALRRLLAHGIDKSQKGPRLQLRTRLNIDYLLKTLVELEVFSLPVVSREAVPRLLDRCPLGEADLVLHADSVQMMCVLLRSIA